MAPAPGKRLGLPFWKVWGASAVTNLGDGIGFTAVPLLAASLTRDPTQIAGLSLALTLPWLLFSLHAGAILDRVDRKQMLVWVNLVRAILWGLVALAVVLGWASLWMLYIVFFLVGIAEVFADNASQVLLPNVVEKEQLEAANARLQIAMTVGNSFVGPPLGSALFVMVAALPFGLNSLGLLLASALIFSLRGHFRPERPAVATSLLSDIRAGLSWLFGHKLLRILAGMVGVMNLTGGAFSAVAVLYALEVLKISEAQFGLLLSASAVGGVLGGLIGERFTKALGQGTSLLLVCVLMGIGPLVIALLPNPWVAASMLAMIGFGGVLWNVIVVSFRQRVVPDALFGRVNSSFRLVALGAIPIGAALGGWIAKEFGLSAPFWFAGVAVTLMAFTVWPWVNNRTLAQAQPPTSA